MDARTLKSGGRKSRFTLVELLVSIAVIAMLMTILLPSLVNAKRLATRLACANNERQTGSAFMLYASDNNDWAPVADSGFPAYELNQYLQQPFEMAPSKTYSWVFSVALPSLYVCPAVSRAGDSPIWAGVEQPYFCTSYAVTIYNKTPVASHGGWVLASSGGYSSRNVARIKAGSILLGEKHYWKNNSTYYNSTSSSGFFCGSIGGSFYPRDSSAQPAWTRHGAGLKANFLYVDGHVGPLRYSPDWFVDNDFIPTQ